MAVAHDNTVSSTGTGTSLTLSSFVIANQSNRYLIVHIVLGDASVGTVSSVTWNGTENLAQLWTAAQSSQLRIAAWGLKNPSAGTHNIVITPSASQDAIFGAATSLYNVDQTTPTGTGVTNTGTSGNNASVGVDDGLTGGIVIGLAERYVGANTGSIADGNGIPKWSQVGTLSTATGQTSRAPALPSAAQRGDTLIATCASENNDTHSCATTGWSKLGQTNSGAGWTVSHWVAIYDPDNAHSGATAGPTITWANSNDASAQVAAYRDGKGSGTVAAYLGTVGAGTTSTHTATGGNTTANNVLAAYGDHATANTALGAPGGSWTERVDAGSATGPCRIVFGDQEIATSGTGSGNLSMTGANAAWVQQQFEIYAAANTQTNLTEREDFGAGDSGNCASVSYEAADTFNTLLWTGTGGTTSLIGAGAIAINPASSATATSVTLSPVSYAVTLQTVSAPTARKATLSPNSYAVTLQSLTANYGRQVTLSPLSYALTLGSLAAKTARKQVLSPVAYALTLASLTAVYGRSVTLSPVAFNVTLAGLGALTARKITLSASSFALTLNDLTTALTRNVTLAPVAFTYAPQPLDVTASVKLEYAVTLSPVTFAFTPRDLTATYTAGTPPPTPVTPSTGSTGGGPSNLFYRGKYRAELRRTILRSAGLLKEAKTTRSRKRKAKRIAAEIVEQFAVEPVVVESLPIVPPEFAALEGLRLQIFDLTLRLKEKEAADAANTARMAQLFEDYQAESKRLDQNEEEEALLIITAMSA